MQAAAQERAAVDRLVASNAKRLGQLQQHLDYCLALDDGLDDDDAEPGQPVPKAGEQGKACESSLLQEALQLVMHDAGAVRRLGTQQQRRLQNFLQDALSPARLMRAASAPAVP